MRKQRERKIGQDVQWKVTKRISRRRKREKKRLSFKKAVSHIVCMNKDDCIEVEEIERCNDFLGVALSSGIEDDFYYFIVIFLGAFKYHE